MPISSEQNFATIFEVSPFATALLKWPGNEVVDWNVQLTLLLGYTREEAFGKKFEELPIFQETADRERIFDEFKRTGSVRGFEVNLVSKTGEPRVVCSSLGILGMEGEQYILASFEDITKRKHAEDEAKNLAGQRQLALNAARMGWWHYDPNTRIATYDERYKEIFGVTGSERPNDEILKRMDPEDLPRVWASVEAALDPNDPKTYSAEYRIHREDGKTLWIQAHGVAEFVGEGPHRKAKSLVGTVADVTEQKHIDQEIRESEERFRTFAEAMPQMAFVADPNGDIIYYNQRWYDYIRGMKGTEGWGWKDKPIHHSDDLTLAVERWKHSLRTGEPYEIEYRLRRHDGEYRWHLGRAMPMRNAAGKITRWLGTNTDIHDLRTVHEELRDAVKARDEFMSVASHELKTPLAALVLQIQFFQRSIEKGDPDAFDPERVRKLIAQADRQASRLTRLIDDMLDTARISEGKLAIQKEQLALNELVQEVVERFSPIMLNGGTPVHLERLDPVVGMWDRFRIEQVIINLLMNAMRYGQKKPVTVNLTVTEERARVTVRDQGLGIRPEAMKIIFNRFERAVSPSEVSGLGLGLFISRQIVEAHGGRIWAESEGPGKGSCFTFELPIARKNGV